MSSTKKGRKIQSVFGKTFPDGSAPAPIGSRRFALAVAEALHRGFGGTHAAVKTVVGLTGANERAVKNWFSAKNGPSGNHLIDLARHSDHVLEAFLLMANRGELVAAKKLVDAKHKLQEMLAIIKDLQEANPDRGE